MIIENITQGILQDTTHRGRVVLLKDEAVAMAKALVEARDIVCGVGGIDSSDKVRAASKWIEEYFPSYAD